LNLNEPYKVVYLLVHIFKHLHGMLLGILVVGLLPFELILDNLGNELPELLLLLFLLQRSLVLLGFVVLILVQ